MKEFENLGLAGNLLRAIDAAGYTAPTPIQRDAIPVMTKGEDIIGIAQTGTGKTAAFVLPLLDRLVRQKKRSGPKTCGALILSPTRELALQIAEDIRVLGRFMKVSSATILGGVKPGPQIRACSRGPDIVVATPGRLLDLMGSGAIDLCQTRQVVLDEADHMMDMGFLPSVRKIMQALPRERQTVLFSATMPPQIRSLASDFLRSPVEISVTPVSKPIERIRQIIHRVEQPEKKRTLVDLLLDPDMKRVVVFSRTKHGANKLAVHLEKSGESAAAIHGNKSQPQREKALAGFKSGATRVLVATDIAARGIDIDNVTHVVNFDLPNVPESYVHRIGRTARAGRDGVAISLVSGDEVKLLRDIERLTNQSLLPNQRPGQGQSHGGAGQAANDSPSRSKPARPRRRRSKGSDNPGSANRPHKAAGSHRRKKNNRKNQASGFQPSDGLRRFVG